MATLSLKLDRTLGTVKAVTKDRVYIRDESVAVTIDGFANGEESLAPYLQVLLGHCVVAEAEITVSPSNDGATATATLNTNTKQLINAFCGCGANSTHDFQLRIFATSMQKPIALGRCSLWNFPAGEGEPSNLPSASEELADLRWDFDRHANDTENPHEVTKEQVGLGNVDNTSDADKPISTAAQTALNNLQSFLGNAITTETSQRTEADASLQSQISAHSTAISQNREEAISAVNAEARARANADSTLADGMNEVTQQFAAFKSKFDFSTISELTDADSLRAVKNAFNNLLQKLKAVNT